MVGAKSPAVARIFRQKGYGGDDDEDGRVIVRI